MKRYVSPRSQRSAEHEPQQLGPDRDVEHRHGFVRDDELRAHHERARDDHSLALPAGELVGIAGRVFLRGP